MAKNDQSYCLVPKKSGIPIIGSVRETFQLMYSSSQFSQLRQQCITRQRAKLSYFRKQERGYYFTEITKEWYFCCVWRFDSKKIFSSYFEGE